MKNIAIILKFISKIVLKRFVDLISLLFALIILFQRNDEGIDLVFLDVGQGDSILIQQNGFQILVDGGRDSTVLFEMSKYVSPKDMHIEILVLTHPHSDHLVGILEVLEKYEVDEVWVNTVEYDLAEYWYFLEQEYPVREVSIGDSLEYMDIRIEVLYPFSKESVQRSNINNESIVIKADLDGHVVYLMGDAEEEIERLLVKERLIEDMDILKAGHHCSKSSSFEGFLGVGTIGVAVCSYGEGNSFGHPHDETLKRFAKCNVQHISTAEEGNIVFRFKE